MSRIVLLNKPYGVLCQFTDQEGRATLADYIRDKGLYPAGRLDRDSEGLVVLTDDGRLQHCIAHPALKQDKTYWVQVEGILGKDALEQLRQGVTLKDGPTKPARVRPMEEPPLWPRNPPVRYRAAIPTSWIALTLTEGRNRQVRRMTAAVGFPTLRLVRWSVGDWSIDSLRPGEHRELDSMAIEMFRRQCPSQNRTPHNGQGQRRGRSSRTRSFAPKRSTHFR